jgi:hypothetical protein
MTFPETLNMEFAINELSFPLVTCTSNSDARFDSYGVLKSGQGTEQILDILNLHVNDQVLRAEYA